MSAASLKTSVTRTAMPSGFARVWTTSTIWGWARWERTKRRAPSFFRRWKAIAIASAAAVASSRREAFATSIPVRSETRVWKLSSASRRPWEISAW